MISRLYDQDPSILAAIRRRAAREEERHGSTSTCWCDLNHVIGRLHSYKKTVETLINMHTTWPELFTEFEITHIPSSTKMAKPLKEVPWTAEEIIHRVTSDPALLERYTAQVQALQKFGLDEEIAEKWRKGLEPRVHAEVLVHHWLENTEGGIRPERFFKGIKFIGSSKPTCKLCSYFFDEHETDVEVRPSHMNIYPDWRLPDVYSHQGPEAEKKRQVLLDKIKVRIGADIGRTLREKLADGRRYDSKTDSTFPQLRVAPPPPPSNVISGMENLTSGETRLNFASGHAAPVLRIENRQGQTDSEGWSVAGIDEEEDDDHDEDGGGLILPYWQRV